MTSQSTQTRSTLHPNALALEHMTAGREIIVFNLAYGILARGPIVVAPHPLRTDTPDVYGEGMLVFYIQETSIFSDTPANVCRFCSDSGLMPYEEGGWWNDRNFTIDASDEHLLPEPDESLIEPFTDYAYWDDYELEEE